MTFPITRSYLSVEALARTLTDLYGLADVRCQLIKAMVCDTYLVTSETGRSILRVYRHNQRTLDQINAELDIIEHLAASGLTVAPALPQSSGNRVLSLDAPEGERHAVLFRFIDGDQLSKSPEPETIRRLGLALAQMHGFLDELVLPFLRPVIDFQMLVLDSIAAFEAAMPNHSALSVLREAAAHIEPRFAQLSSAPPAYGLVHGDVIPSNLLITPNESIALLDFDFCGYGWRAYDLASFLSEIAFWNMPQATIDAFWNGYESLRPLSSAERESVTVFEAARNIFAFGTPAEHINEWGSVYLSDRLIDRLLKNLQASLIHLS